MLALASHLVHDLPGAGELCPHGPLDIGQWVRLPGIARTLSALAADGRSGFYGGEFGRGLLELGAGHFAPGDFETSVAEWCDPLRTGAWGHELWTVPPPSQGYLTLAGAAVAEAAGLGTDPDDPAWAHLMVESWRAVGHDRPDVLFDGADGTALLDPARLEAAAARISAVRAAAPDVTHGRRLGRAFDRPGRGRGDHAPVRHRRGRPRGVAHPIERAGLRLAPVGAVHRHLPAQPGCRLLARRGPPGRGRPASGGPPHTLSPMLVTSADGSLSHLVGAMGGDAQPQILVQLLARMLRAGQDPARAVSAPRMSLDAPAAGPFRLWWGDDLTVLAEADAPPGWMDGLRERGHQVRAIRAFDPTAVGCAQIIEVTSVDGRSHVLGASDPRSPEGAALGR